jgi:glutamine synthetase
MDPRQVKTADDARQIVRERNLSHVKIGVFDVDGVLRGKYLGRDKFFGALDSGAGFCDVVLGWDSNDQLYDNVTYTGWHTAYPDAQVRIIPDSCRDLPTEGGPNESGTTGGMLLFLAEFAGAAEAICPRGLLRRVIDKAAAMGFAAKSALEYEFFVFEETPHSVRDKFYRGLKPISPGYFGYSVLRNSVMSDWYHALLQLCEGMDMGLEGLHTETGAGVLEAAIRVDDTLASADKAALFKTFTKVLAQKRGWMATFMAKWSKDWPGCGGHMHVSLWSQDKSAFFDVAAPHRMSATMRQFVAGQQALMPELLALVAPTVNSYRRLIPGFWAPTSATWGVENRTTALRVIPGSPKSQRVEYRIAAADGNPYLTLAAALASGLWGIENKLELGAPIEGNAYAKEHAAALDLPRTLGEAAQRLKTSKPARALFGDAFVDHYAATRTWEEREFRKHISDWELDRYFEII